MGHLQCSLDLTADDRAFLTCEVRAIVDLLSVRGIDSETILAGSSIEPSMLFDPRTRISLHQQIAVQRNVMKMVGAFHPAFEVGRQSHLSAYGIAGFTLLSSPTLREALCLAQRYSPLLNLKFGLEIVESGAQVALHLLDHYPIDHDARAFCLDFEVSKTITLLRDLLGDQFTPNRILMGRAGGVDFIESEAPFECPIAYGSPSTWIEFDAAVLDKPLAQYNAVTLKSCMEVCDAAMEELAGQYDLRQHVKRLLMEPAARIASISEIADKLCMSERTLRRRLESLGSSYNTILEDIRKTLAIRYLCDTAMTTEAIAEVLGYSDSANFRHAFKRWTGHPPREYRVRHAGQAALTIRLPAALRRVPQWHQSSLMALSWV